MAFGTEILTTKTLVCSDSKEAFVHLHLEHDTDISNFLFVDAFRALAFIQTAAHVSLIENLF